MCNNNVRILELKSSNSHTTVSSDRVCTLAGRTQTWDRPPFYLGRGLSDVWNMAAHGLSTEELYRCYEVLEGAKGEAASEVCAGGPT